MDSADAEWYASGGPAACTGLAPVESEDELELQPGTRGPEGMEGKVRLRLRLFPAPSLELPVQDPVRKGAHLAAWVAGDPDPRSQRSAPCKHAASSFSIEIAENLSTPSPNPVSPEEAEEWGRIEASFSSPSTWGGGPAQ